jgi:hypothetical protein
MRRNFLRLGSWPTGGKDGIEQGIVLHWITAKTGPGRSGL